MESADETIKNMLFQSLKNDQLEGLKKYIKYKSEVKNTYGLVGEIGIEIKIMHGVLFQTQKHGQTA